LQKQLDRVFLIDLEHRTHIHLKGALTMTWSNWINLGGICTSAPATVSWQDNRIDAFVIDTGNAISHIIWDGSAWSGWHNHGGDCRYGVAAASWAPNRLDIFTIGVQGALHHKAWNGSGWSDWHNLGGNFISAPAAVSWGDNRIDVFAIGTDNAIYHIAWDGSSWSAWHNLGGDCRYGVAAASWAPGRLDVFTIGTQGALHQKAWDGAWSDWYSLGSNCISAPAAVSWANNRIDVCAIGADNATYHIAWDAGWSAWESLAGDCRYGVGAASWAANRLDIFTIDTTGSLNHKAWPDVAIPGNSGSPGAPNAFAQELLDAHNRYRAEVGAPPLQWSNQLAVDAQPWANYLTSLGGIQLPHSNTPGQGESLFGGSPPGAFGLTRMVDDWGSEKQSFAPGPFTGAGFDGGMIGHYTQMIWRSTTHVGCAVANDGVNEFLVCRYNPPGNVIGQYVP
jgi:hypothetical protein